MKKLLLLLFLVSYLFAEEEIEVSLATKKSLFPIYVSKIHNEKSSFDDTYLSDLEKVLRFDLNYNGFTEVVKSEHQKDFKISHFDQDVAFENTFWKNQKISYVLKTEVNQKKLKGIIYNTLANSLNSLSEIELTGDLSIDRGIIHSFCDNLQEELFNVKGIASLKILYSVREKNLNDSNLPWKSEIWISDYDGHNAKQLSYDSSYFVHPIFVPNKKNEYVFVSYINGQPKLFKSSITNSYKTPLVHLRGNQLLPSFSSDSKKLAFICDASGRPDIFIQHFDKDNYPLGKPIQLYSYPRATNASPVFSPDNEKIAFVSDKDGSPRIYVIKISDTFSDRKRPQAQLITTRNRQNVSPSWSKDGKKLAYSAKNDTARQIWIYDFETMEEWQLTSDTKNKENPTWANDSLHIIYNTEDEKESELYLINIKQKVPVKITKGDGKKRFPCFEP